MRASYLLRYPVPSVCVALLLGVTLLAVPVETAAPDGKSVVEAALTALGGDNYLRLQNREARGRVYSFFRDQLSGADRSRSLVRYVDPSSPKDLGIEEREWFGKKQDYSFLFLPQQAYELTFRGARPMEDEAWSRYQRTTRNDILYLLRQRHNEPGMTFDYGGSEVQITRHVEVVEITDSTGQMIRVSFDHNTHLPVRQTFQWLDETTRERNDEITEFDKYRDIGGGVMWPFTIERSRNGYKVYQVFADSVQANVPVPPGAFELPAGSKMLRK